MLNVEKKLNGYIHQAQSLNKLKVDNGLLQTT